jgi:hypothetical protein
MNITATKSFNLRTLRDDILPKWKKKILERDEENYTINCASVILGTFGIKSDTLSAVSFFLGLSIGNVEKMFDKCIDEMIHYKDFMAENRKYDFIKLELVCDEYGYFKEITPIAIHSSHGWVEDIL